MKNQLIFLLLVGSALAQSGANPSTHSYPPDEPTTTGIPGGLPTETGSCAGIDPKASKAIFPVIEGWKAQHSTGDCHVHASQQGYLLPDPSCTPGAINPTVTQEMIQNHSFSTKCIRNTDTSEHMKSQTYTWYNITHPTHNTGASQSCELDHLIPLELGGADTLDNIWPQCGPSGVTLDQRFFKKKDLVENYLTEQVRQGKMSLADAQKAIATDWTPFLKDIVVYSIVRETNTHPE